MSQVDVMHQLTSIDPMTGYWSIDKLFCSLHQLGLMLSCGQVLSKKKCPSMPPHRRGINPATGHNFGSSNDTAKEVSRPLGPYCRTFCMAFEKSYQNVSNVNICTLKIQAPLTSESPQTLHTASISYYNSF